jgi:hypothetical protein
MAAEQREKPSRISRHRAVSNDPGWDDGKPPTSRKVLVFVFGRHRRLAPRTIEEMKVSAIAGVNAEGDLRLDTDAANKCDVTDAE